ncbi:ATP-binding protein [Oscillatoria sp. CS-180]|uniref:ATP-binding protein n=1 Tax=Oscillatoria sp. CS-180 TaxID=3021720 RepID=UPI00232E1145|nr:ATP-binding protein [Oscillatoria sp. CS-180]MDB9526493.1 ATP-binding protein [Oscillatoria sp. CS-180]
MKRSFRLRLALLSTVLAGSALVGFSGLAWRLIYSAKISQLDTRLENQIQRFDRPLPTAGDSRDWDTNLTQDLDAEMGSEIALQILDAQGEPFYQSESWDPAFDRPSLYPPRPALSPTSDLPPPEDSNGRPPPPPPNLRPRLMTLHTADASWRVGATSFPAHQVAIATNLQGLRQDMAVIRNTFLVTIPSVLLLVAVGAWALSGSALRSVRQLTATMQQVTATDLNQRVSLSDVDIEFTALIEVFNRMLARLERSFMQASRFSADAAHELKTPLAVLQGELEQGLQQAEAGSPLQQTLSSFLEEVRRLSGIVRKLLLLSQADAGQMRLNKESINLSALLTVLVEDLDLLADDLSIQADIAPNLGVQGDRDLIAQVLQNLTSNAVKYNLSNGWIRIEARQRQGQVQITVANASNPLSKAERDRIFDRFYRGDPARTRKVDGLGLGLSLSQEIIRAHQGTLILDDTFGNQTVFILCLPNVV